MQPRGREQLERQRLHETVQSRKKVGVGPSHHEKGPHGCNTPRDGHIADRRLSQLDAFHPNPFVCVVASVRCWLRVRGVPR